MMNIISFCLTIAYVLEYVAAQKRDDCHCLTGSCVPDVDSKWICPALSWSCAKGWTNGPYCNVECPPLKYDFDCNKSCHCPPGDTCNRISGLCNSDKCAAGYHGASCQKLLPRLGSLPTVSLLNCSTIQVTWDRWNQHTDTGEPGIHSYTIQYCPVTEITRACVNGSLMDFIPDVPEPAVNETEGMLSIFLTGLQTNTSYGVAVRTNRLEYNKKIEGRRSALSFIATCMTSLLPVNLTTLSTIPSPDTVTLPGLTSATSSVPLSFFNVTETVNDTSITIEWTLPNVQSSLYFLKDILISYTRLRYKACPPGSTEEITTELRLSAKTTEYKLYLLSPYTEYRYSIALEYTLSSDTSSTASSELYVRDFSTTSSAPTKPVSGLVVTDTGSTWLMLSWQDYPCQFWNGDSFLRYEVEVRVLGSSLNLIRVSTSTSYNVTSLLPSTRYSVRVRPVSSISAGVWTALLPANNQVPTLQEAKAYNSTCVNFRLARPHQFWSPTQQYKIVYTPISDPRGPITDTSTVTKDLPKVGGTSNVTHCGLQPDLTYNLRIFDSFGYVPEGGNTNISLLTVTSDAPSPDSGTTDAEAEDGFPVGWTVALVLILVVVLAFGLLLLWLYCKGQVERKYGVYKHQSMDNEADQVDDCSLPSNECVYPTSQDLAPVYLTGYWCPIYKVNDLRHVVLDKDAVKELYTGKKFITFEQEFSLLPKGQQYSWSVASQQAVYLNRASHLIPYDHNRVVIGQSALGDVDYINASHIKGYTGKCSYIATTSPFNEQCAMQFWQMIYEQKVTQIVMMTNMVDDGITKCIRYWPEKIGEDEELVFGRVTVQLTEVNVFAHFVLYKLEVLVTDVIRHITLYRYISWPEHGTPSSPFPLLDFCSAVRTSGHVDSGPMVVHCGTGCSTTGFFIALDYLIDEAVANNNNISVYNAVSYLRDCRSFMVRTQKQYMLIYDCMFEYILGAGKFLSHDLRSKYKVLSQSDSQPVHTNFRLEVKLLRRYTPSLDSSDLVADALKNKAKNRFSTVLPMDSYRVKLSLDHGTSDYINAIFLDGYLQSKAFILTQTPMHDTVVDFWRMVYEQGVCAIVMMDDNQLKDDSCAVYWPDSSDSSLYTPGGDRYPTHIFGQFVVELINTRQEEDVCFTRHMVISNKLQPSEPKRHIKQFQVLQWPLRQPKPPKTGLHMLKLKEKVEEWQRSVVSSYNQTVASPVVVHCLDGAVHSGVYVATAIICEKMAVQNRVNIFLTVKEIKHRRKDAVGSLNQYRYLHRVLWDFINTKLEDRSLEVLVDDPEITSDKPPLPAGAGMRRSESGYGSSFHDGYESYNEDSDGQ